MNFLRIGILLGFSLAAHLGYSQTPTELYQQGLKDFQEQKFVDAFDSFQKSNAAQADNPYTLYNWGLAAFKIEKKGLALGLWRRALSVDPEFGPARKALEFAEENMPDDSFAKGQSWLNILKRGILREISVQKLLLVNVLLFLFGGWLSLRYLGQRRRAIEDELPMPNLSPIAVFFVALFFVSLVTAILKLQTLTETRATVTAADVQLMTAPSKDSNPVFTLIEGVEVDVNETENDWTLVSYPDGMTGWVPSASLFINAGKTP